MADTKLSALTAATALNLTDLLYLDQAGTSKSITADFLQPTGLTTFSDANYTILSTDVIVLQTGSLTASRTLTLPAASAHPKGFTLWIIDGSGSVTSTNTLVVNRAGADTINGGTSSTMTLPYGRFILVSDGVSAWYAPRYSAMLPDIQLFTGNGTWTKQANTTTVEVVQLGGGGGGGAGRRGPSGSIQGGGCGGGGGAYTWKVFRAVDLNAQETVTIGAGGAGAAVQTVDASDGATGTAGTATTFKSATACSALGGAGGGGGKGAATGTAGVGGIGSSNGGLGAASSSSGATGSVGTIGGQGGSGGSAGGGIDATPTQKAGGAGAGYAGVNGGGTGPTAGTAGGGVGGNGLNAPALLSTYDLAGGQSGAGGGSNTAGAGGAGGNGGTYGSGGGGGGASLNGSNSGAGGNGANGACLVLSY